MPGAGAKWTTEAETAMLLAAVGDKPPSSMDWEKIRDAVGAVTGSRPTFEAARQHLAGMRRKVDNGPTEGSKNQENTQNKAKTSKSGPSAKSGAANATNNADDATSLTMSGGGRKRKIGVTAAKVKTEDPEATPTKPKRARKPKAKKEEEVKMEDIKEELAHDGDTTVSEDGGDFGGSL